jgi:Active DUF488-N3 subclade
MTLGQLCSDCPEGFRQGRTTYPGVPEFFKTAAYCSRSSGMPIAASGAIERVSFSLDLSSTPHPISRMLAENSRWAAFKRKFRREMSEPVPRRDLDLLAALLQNANLSIGCYCEDENSCHRSILRELLIERGAQVI